MTARPTLLIALILSLCAGFLPALTFQAAAAPSAASDMAWTTHGDATGFHVLTSTKAGDWQTAATLAEPWIEADQWVGNACITGSGKRAVVVYAPRHFTNRAHLFDRGAFAAVVDLTTGDVRKLNVTVSLAYYNPGCGTGETAVLTQSGVVDMGKTRLHVLDTERGAVTRSHELAGEITSSLPVGKGIVAASGARLVEVDTAGSVREIARTGALPFRLHPDADGGIVFMERHGETAVVRRFGGKSIADLGRGPLTELNVLPGTAGRVFVTGKLAAAGALPAAVKHLNVPATAEVSTAGEATLTRSKPGRITTMLAANGAAKESALRPVATSRGLAPTPAVAVATAARTAALAPSNDPVDQDRYCSVARNDARTQVKQPHWSQVEWAADLAVQGALRFQRPADWKHSGMPTAWRPQEMFEPVPLEGGGRVPASILLGVLAQESNLWQASFHVAVGVSGNPLIGAYYGVEDGWGINWTEADCGYGVSQMTDGMRRAGRAKPGEKLLEPAQQLAIGVDYATNIAAGLQILQRKWNQTRKLGIIVNGGDPRRIETWFAALWAYNSGVNPQANTGNNRGCEPGPECTDAPNNGPGGNYGLGWSNNPARPDYPANRTAFLDNNNYDDARNPQRWPYPEKVIGWAAYPIVKYTGGDDYEAGYKQAWWTTTENRTSAKPPIGTFCNNTASCNPSNLYTPTNPCTRSDFHCWWHVAAEWKSCAPDSTLCGYEPDNLTPPGAIEPADADVGGAYADEPNRQRYSPRCNLDGLPSGTLVIDDVPDSVPSLRSGCTRTWSSAGNFDLTFAAHTDGLYHSKVDFHQIGGGFGGHFWFAHARTPAADQAKNWRVTGTWTLNRAINGWARVMVHMPDHGAHTQQAQYRVDLGNGQIKSRSLLQKTQANKWVSLGAFPFSGTPKVTLTNITRNGDGVEDVAYDAVAFQPLPGKPAQMVALGDSYSSGEGASTDAKADYYQETDDSGVSGSAYRNGCHRSRHAWSRLAVLPGTAASVGSRADSFDPAMDYHLLACSGAETEHLLPSDGTANAFGDTAAGMFREVSQLDSGFVDENTTMVTLTIGGNDAHFADIMRICTIGTPSLLEDCRHSRQTWDPQSFATLETYVPEMINTKVRDSIGIAVRKVQQRAPNAKIVLMGYPRLFPPQADGVKNPDCKFFPAIVDPEMNWLNHMADMLNWVLQEHAVTMSHAGMPVTYSDPRDEFQLMNACSLSETIHRVVFGKTEGEDPGLGVSQQSFHPTIAGSRNYANAFITTLRTNNPGQGLPALPTAEVAKAELEELRTYGRESEEGWDRSLFGNWTTVTPNCSTRETVLRRDNLNATTACPVTSGRWFSPYDNRSITTSDPARDIQIDHLVPLKDAWISGASKWTPGLRKTFANDIEHPQLLAVSVSSNTSKQDRSPAEWLPATSYLCTYARAWVHTKSVYRLSVSDLEYTTLKEILGTRC